MKKLLVGKSAWLVSLMFLSAALGSIHLTNFADNGTGAVLLFGAVFVIVVACTVHKAFPLAAYLLAVGSSAAVGGFAAIIADRLCGHGTAVVLPALAGMMYAFQGTGIALALGDFDRVRDRFGLFGLCAGTGLLAVYLLFNPLDANSDVIFLTLALGLVSIYLANSLFYSGRWTHVSDITWKNALVQTNDIYVRPVEWYRECLRNSDG